MTLSTEPGTASGGSVSIYFVRESPSLNSRAVTSLGSKGLFTSGIWFTTYTGGALAYTGGGGGGGKKQHSQQGRKKPPPYPGPPPHPGPQNPGPLPQNPGPPPQPPPPDEPD